MTTKRKKKDGKDRKRVVVHFNRLNAASQIRGNLLKRKREEENSAFP